MSAIRILTFLEAWKLLWRCEKRNNSHPLSVYKKKKKIIDLRHRITSLIDMYFCLNFPESNDQLANVHDNDIFNSSQRERE